MNEIANTTSIHQSAQWNYLIKAYQANKLPHALLLAGNKGLGKQTFAMAFAKFLLCLDNIQANACGNCRSCKLFQAGTHPDYYHLRPEEEGKAIRVEQVRELIAQLAQTAQQNNYKIAIIEPATALNLAAANALLKTLEEPRPNTLLMLIVEQVSLLPATVRSRCQIVKFIASKQKLVYSEQFEERKKLLDDLKKLSLMTGDPIRIASDWNKKNINILIDWLIAITMDIISLNFSNNLAIMHQDLLNELNWIKQKISFTDLFVYLDKLYLAKKQLSFTNLNQQLLLENLFIKWNQNSNG